MSSSSNQVGLKVGPFVLLEKVGEGSYGKVFKALSNEGAEIALKVSTKIEMAKNEEACLNQLKGHVGVQNIIWSGAHQEEYVIASDLYFEDLDNMRYLLPERKYNATTTGKLIYKLINVLEYVHSRKWVHRDIKNDNLMISFPSGPNLQVNLKLIDFGIALRYENENGQKIDNFRQRRNGGRPHGSPSEYHDRDHLQMDDLQQLIYASFKMQGIVLRSLIGKSKSSMKNWKDQMVENPESVVPPPMGWLLPFFNCAGSNYHQDKVDYGKLREAIGKCDGGELNGELVLEEHQGYYRLV